MDKRGEGGSVVVSECLFTVRRGEGCGLRNSGVVKFRRARQRKGLYGAALRLAGGIKGEGKSELRGWRQINY